MTPDPDVAPVDPRLAAWRTRRGTKDPLRHAAPYGGSRVFGRTTGDAPCGAQVAYPVPGERWDPGHARACRDCASKRPTS